MATLTITPIKTFVSGENVTPAKLNELSQSNVALTAGTIAEGDIAGLAVSAGKLANTLDLTGKTVTLPVNSVVRGAILNGEVIPEKLAQKYTLLSSQLADTKSSIDFPGIPSWATRVSVYINGLSAAAASDIIIRLGTSVGIEATSYQSISGVNTNTPTGSSDQSTVGFLISGTTALAANAHYGASVISKFGGNTWVHMGNLGSPTLARAYFSSGAKSLSNPLTQVRVTTVNGVTLFDAGEVSVAYE